MTVREFINELLNFDMDEDIEFYLEDELVLLNVVEFAYDPDCPYIMFNPKERKNKNENNQRT